MHYLNVLGLAGVVGATLTPPMAGKHKAFMALEKIMGRQIEYCEPVTAPYTCERSCGEGYTECVEFPTCYNPGNGESCCSDGTYCPAGYYCTDEGCCPEGYTLEECGAGSILSTLPPGLPTSVPTATPTFSPFPTTTATFTTSDDDDDETTTWSYTTPTVTPETTSTDIEEPTFSTPSPTIPTPTVDAAGQLAAPIAVGLGAMLMAL